VLMGDKISMLPGPEIDPAATDTTVIGEDKSTRATGPVRAEIKRPGVPARGELQNARHPVIRAVAERATELVAQTATKTYAAIAQREYRLRQKVDGIGVCGLWLDPDDRNFLVRAGYLLAQDRDDKKKLGEAVARLVREFKARGQLQSGLEYGLKMSGKSGMGAQ